MSLEKLLKYYKSVGLERYAYDLAGLNFIFGNSKNFTEEESESLYSKSESREIRKKITEKIYELYPKKENLFKKIFLKDPSFHDIQNILKEDELNEYLIRYFNSIIKSPITLLKSSLCLIKGGCNSEVSLHGAVHASYELDNPNYCPMILKKVKENNILSIPIVGICFDILYKNYGFSTIIDEFKNLPLFYHVSDLEEIVANSHFRLKNYDESERGFLNLIKKKKNHGEYYISLVQTYIANGDFDNARKYANLATKLNVSKENKYLLKAITNLDNISISAFIEYQEYFIKYKVQPNILTNSQWYSHQTHLLSIIKKTEEKRDKNAQDLFQAIHFYAILSLRTDYNLKEAYDNFTSNFLKETSYPKEIERMSKLLSGNVKTLPRKLHKLYPITSNVISNLLLRKYNPLQDNSYQHLNNFISHFDDVGLEIFPMFSKTGGYVSRINIGKGKNNEGFFLKDSNALPKKVKLTREELSRATKNLAKVVDMEIFPYHKGSLIISKEVEGDTLTSLIFNKKLDLETYKRVIKILAIIHSSMDIVNLVPYDFYAKNNERMDYLKLNFKDIKPLVQRVSESKYIGFNKDARTCNWMVAKNKIYILDYDRREVAPMSHDLASLIGFVSAFPLEDRKDFVSYYMKKMTKYKFNNSFYKEVDYALMLRSINLYAFFDKKNLTYLRDSALYTGKEIAKSYPSFSNIFNSLTNISIN